MKPNPSSITEFQHFAQWRRKSLYRCIWVGAVSALIHMQAHLHALSLPGGDVTTVVKDGSGYGRVGGPGVIVQILNPGNLKQGALYSRDGLGSSNISPVSLSTNMTGNEGKGGSNKPTSDSKSQAGLSKPSWKPGWKVIIGGHVVCAIIANVLGYFLGRFGILR